MTRGVGFVPIACFCQETSATLASTWIQKSTATRNQMKVSPNAAPWTSNPARSLSGLSTTQRVRDLVDVAWLAYQQAVAKGEPHDDVISWFVDVSQSVSRKPWSAHVMNLTQSTELYSFGHDAVIAPAGLMLLQGHSSSLTFHVQGLSALAGEGMFLPSVATCLYCFLGGIDGDWWAPRTKAVEYSIKPLPQPQRGVVQLDQKDNDDGPA